MNEKPTAIIIFIVEIQTAFSLRSERSPLLLNILLKVVVDTLSRKEIKDI